jgi:hypothetical protein
VDDNLKVITQVQHSFFKSSAELKDEYTSAGVPDNTLLFTADAGSYYTKTPTNKALRKIAAYLRANMDRFNTLPTKALIDALYVIVKNNLFTFGNTTLTQNDGKVMGTPPAPYYATVYFTIHKETILVEFHDNLWKYRRFIDDLGGGHQLGNMQCKVDAIPRASE